MKCYAIAAAVMGVLAAAGCSSSTAPANGPMGGHSGQIEAVGSALGCSTSGGAYGGGTQTCTFFFNPTPDTVKVGAAVSFKFDDVGHTVTWDAPGGLADIGTVSNGITNSVVADGTPTTPGTYTWHCSIHTYMHGTMVVTQ